MSSRSAVALTSLLLLGACREREQVPTRTLEVLLSGCAAMASNGACELPTSRRIRAYLPRGSADTILTLDGKTITATIVTLDRGVRYDLTLPAGSRTLSLRAGDAAIEIPLFDSAPTPTLDEVAKLRADGELDQADTILAAARATLEEKHQPRALREAARNARARGDPRAAELYLESTNTFEAQGRYCEAAESALASTFTAIRLGRRFTLARAALDRHERALARAGPCADQRARGHYYRAMLALELGELDAAAIAFAEAEQHSRRLGHEVDVINARQGRALALERLGRYADALALLEADVAARTTSAADCEGARAFLNLAWIALVMRDADPSATRDPRPFLERAYAQVRTKGCENAAVQANIEANFALEAIQRGRNDEAIEWVEKARNQTAAPDPALELWMIDALGRIAIERGHYDQAERAYAELRVLAENTLSAEAAWRAAIGAATTFERRGELKNALKEYERAEELLDRESTLVAVFGGRDSFLVGRERGTRAFVELLLRTKQERRAAEIVRRARARLLVPLFRTMRLGRLAEEQRARWEQAVADYHSARDALDELVGTRWQSSKKHAPDWNERHRAARRATEHALERALLVLGTEPSASEPRPPGELTLAYYPLARGWAGFAELDGAVVAQSFTASIAANLAPEKLSSALLAPFEQELDRAERVRVLSYGPVREINFHVLPWRGARLGATLPVAYGVDRPSRTSTSSIGKGALIIADPRGDLSGSGREAEQIAAPLRQFFGQIKILRGREAGAGATRAALAENLFFHFAGHGELSGDTGWEHALLLAGEARLTVGDVLTLPRVPRWVVLSACRSASAPAHSRIETAGLAQAFVAVGSEGVLAAVDVVDDEAQARIISAIYQHLRFDEEDRSGWILARALSAAIREATPADSLRVFVP